MSSYDYHLHGIGSARHFMPSADLTYDQCEEVTLVHVNTGLAADCGIIQLDKIILYEHEADVRILCCVQLSTGITITCYMCVLVAAPVGVINVLLFTAVDPHLSCRGAGNWQEDMAGRCLMTYRSANLQAAA